MPRQDDSFTENDTKLRRIMVGNENGQEHLFTFHLGHWPQIALRITACRISLVQCLATIPASDTFFVEPGALRGTRTPKFSFLQKNQAHRQQYEKEAEDSNT